MANTTAPQKKTLVVGQHVRVGRSSKVGTLVKLISDSLCMVEIRDGNNPGQTQSLRIPLSLVH